jgi:hypothetical protein
MLVRRAKKKKKKKKKKKEKKEKKRRREEDRLDCTRACLYSSRQGTYVPSAPDSCSEAPRSSRGCSEPLEFVAGVRHNSGTQ